MMSASCRKRAIRRVRKSSPYFRIGRKPTCGPKNATTNKIRPECLSRWTFLCTSVLLIGAPWFLKADLLIRAFQKIDTEFPNTRVNLLGHFPDEHLLRELIGDSRLDLK
jgi:hypothetical protein